MANRQVEPDLVVAHHDKGQRSVQADFVLHTPNEHSSGHIQEWPCSGERVGGRTPRADTAPRGRSRCSNSASVAELCLKVSVDHLAPGHGLRATGVGAEDGREVDAAASAAVDPSAGVPGGSPPRRSRPRRCRSSDRVGSPLPRWPSGSTSRLKRRPPGPPCGGSSRWVVLQAPQRLSWRAGTPRTRARLGSTSPQRGLRATTRLLGSSRGPNAREGPHAGGERVIAGAGPGSPRAP